MPLARQTDQGYDVNSNVTTVTDVANSTVVTNTWASSGNNNLMSQQSGHGATSSYTYTPAGTSPIKDYVPSAAESAQANSTTFAYDNSSNPMSSTNSIGSSTVTRQGVASVNCGAQPGQACTSVDARGKTTSFGYDGDGNLTSVTPPSPLGAVAITYDANSRVDTVTDGKGQVTAYTYDNLDHITLVSMDDGSDVYFTTTPTATPTNESTAAWPCGITDTTKPTGSPPATDPVSLLTTTMTRSGTCSSLTTPPAATSIPTPT